MRTPGPHPLARPKEAEADPVSELRLGAPLLDCVSEACGPFVGIQIGIGHYWLA